MTGDTGRVQQGREWSLVVELPAAPDAMPTALVTGPDGLVETFRMAADRQGEAFVFRLSRFLGDRYATPGFYTAAVYWTVSGSPRGVGRVVCLTPGGAAVGAVISMLSVRRPDAVRLVKQHDSGLSTQGRNPR